MRRISIVGNSGSGKTTLASRLAQALDLPHIELDAWKHQPGWEPRPVAEMRAMVGAAIAEDGWVIDGNYSEVRDLIWARADTIVWMDPPRRTVMRQIIWRTLGRVARRRELWNGNRERWRNFFAFHPQESVIAWAWTRHHVYRERYGAAMSDPANAHLRFVRVRTRADTARLIAGAQPPR
ncbi:hypothetical protein J5X84_24745 [Streptosporangiaceae bacterium NEAU-GS5]|nr:hypothetical protein [Streptosporangiaceae bacterium NEAU-GS5]